MLTRRLFTAAPVVCLALAALALPLASCGPEGSAHAEQARAGDAPETGRVTITDDLDREVRLATPKRRIAVIAPHAVDILLDLGVSPVLRPALRGEAPDAWEELRVVGLDHSSGPSVEQLVAAQPDLVVITSPYARFIPAIERAVGAPVLCLDINDIDKIKETIRTLGLIVGREEAASALAERVQARIDGELEHARELASRAERPARVFAMFGTTNSFYAFIEESYVGSLIRASGAELVTGESDGHRVYRELVPLSMERLLLADPEVIVVLSHGEGDEDIRRMSRHPAWNGLRAVREDRVVRLPDDLFVVRPGSDPDRAVRTITRALYPEAGPDGAP